MCIANSTLVSLFAKKISSRTLVIPRTWVRNQVVFHLQRKTTRRMGQSRWIDDEQIQRKQTPSFPSHETVVPRNAQKQRRWKIIYTLLCRLRYDWNCFSHTDFCQSAQYLRSSLRLVWRVKYLSKKHRETCCVRAIWPIVRASKIIDNDTHILDWDSFTRKSIAEVQGTRWKASTTRSIVKSLHWCRIPETVEIGQYFMTKHTDEFFQFAEPVTCCEYTWPRFEKSIHAKGWIRGNTKIGLVLEVTTSYLEGNYGVEIRIESVNKDNSHSWVRISHGLNRLVSDLSNNKEYDDNEQETSETKTEAFPLKTDVFALQADQRLKQNREDLPLLAHLQGLYLFLKENRLILNQELNSITLLQRQKGWTLFFDTENYFEKKMGRSNSGDWKMIFGTNLSTLNIGLMMCGRARWQGAEATRKDFNTVLTRQDKFLTSEFFKVIQGAIPWILHFRTMC